MNHILFFLSGQGDNAVHKYVDRGSYFELRQPWVVGPKTFTTNIIGQLFHVDASTSLQEIGGS